MKKSALIFILSFMVLFSPVFVHADTDRTNLQIHRNEVASAINNQMNYEEHSYEAFNQGLVHLGGLSAIDDLLNDELAEQATIDQMDLALTDILGYLTLRTTYNDTYLLYLQEDTSRVLSPYTQRSIALYNAEMNRIKDVLDEPTSGEVSVTLLRTDISNVVNLLVLLGNKTSLLSSYQEAEAIFLDGSAYLPQTYTLFLSSYNAIDESLESEIGMTKSTVVQYVDASQNEVDVTLSKIESALSLLELKPDKTAFITLIQSIQSSFNSDLYTPDSSALYLNEITILYNQGMLDTTTLSELSELTTDVESASSLLVMRADISNLDRLNNLAIVAYYEERASYTENSYNLFKQAVIGYGNYLYVNTKLNDLNISQAEIDALAVEVSNALNLLEELQDNQNLLSEYNHLLTIDLSKFTPASVLLFQTELTQIYENIMSENLNQALYLQTTNDLLNAEILLVEKADTSQLNELYAQSQTYEEEDYSTSSYQYLNLVMEESRNMILNENIDQASIDGQVLKLDHAIHLLEKPTDLVVIYVGDKVNLLDYVTLGDSFVVSFDSHDNEIVSLNAFGEATALSFGQTKVVITLDNGITQTLDVLVKANISVSTFVLATLVPVMSIGLAGVMLFYKPSVIQKVKSIFIKKRG